MAEEAIKLGGKKKSMFIDKVKELLPEGGNLNLCLTCGACSSGCPATGLEGMDPRKFLRMAALGMDDEITSTPWVWMCSMCQRCIYVCPMKIDIPQLVYNARASWPRAPEACAVTPSRCVRLAECWVHDILWLSSGDHARARALRWSTESPRRASIYSNPKLRSLSPRNATVFSEHVIRVA